MRLQCACSATARVLTVEFYCKECRAFRCDECVRGCKEAHPDFVLDRRVIQQKHVRSALSLAKVKKPEALAERRVRPRGEGSAE